MYFRVVDYNFQTVTSFLDEDLLDDEQLLTLNGSTISLTLPTGLDGIEFIIEDMMIQFIDETDKSHLMTIMAISYEDEFIRTIECESLDTALNGQIANSYVSNKPQTIDYFINRELYDTEWEVRLNENSSRTALVDCSGTGDTKKARLFAIAEAFNVELDFVPVFNNARLKHAYIDIYRSRGTDLSNSVTLRTGDEIETINRTTDIYTTFTEVKVVGNNADITNVRYDDGIYYTLEGSNIIYNREAKTARGGKRVMGYYSSPSDVGTVIFSEGLAYLKDNDTTKFNLDVSVIEGIETFQVYDWVTIIDNERTPEIRVKARVLEKSVSRTDPSQNKALFGNYILLESGISSQLLALQKQINSIKERPTLTIEADNGLSFINGETKTTKLTATVFKNNEDVTSQYDNADFFWYKVDKNGVHDEIWEQSVINSGSVVSVTNLDVSEIAMIKCTLNDRKNELVQAIYFLNGLKNLAYRVGQLRTDDMLVFGIIADTHCARHVINKPDVTDNIKAFSHINNIAEFSNMVDLDFLVHVGDMVEGVTTKKQNTQDLQEVMAMLGQSNCPYFATVGNHDDNRYGNKANGNVMNQYIEPNEMYKIVTSPSKAFNIIENQNDKNMYFYYDVPGKKYRAIFLNCYDTPYTSTNGEMDYKDYGGYREKQINWLIDVLKNTPENYQVAFFQHVSLGTGYHDANLTYVHNTDIVQGIIGAYKNGTSYSKSNDHADFKVSVNVNFTGQRIVSFVANGHHHSDRLKVVNNINNLSVNLSKPSYRVEEWGTVNQDSWNILLVDTKNKKVKALRYGFGSDVEFSYS
ncbi:metallophosphoesterase [Vagococcus fluvialis]|uniref:metallophosphoesterase n=1 Tax=Vagococcus fluvialis TaxID=2738 RepID=UPI0037BA74CF